MNNASPPDSHLAFARLAGEVAESFSFNRSIGQIYGLLYVGGNSLSLEEIARMLSMSKGNASINLRVLESWGAVRSASVSGSRRDHYQVNDNLKEIALNRLQEGLGRRLSMVEESLAGIISSLGGEAAIMVPARERLHKLQKMVSGVRKALKALPSLLKWLPGTR